MLGMSPELMFLFPLVGLKRNLSLLDIFSGGLNQIEVLDWFLNFAPHKKATGSALWGFRTPDQLRTLRRPLPFLEMNGSKLTRTWNPAIWQPEFSRHLFTGWGKNHHKLWGSFLLG